MRLFDRTELNTLDDLFLWSLEDLYDCEQRIVDALPKMIEAASPRIEGRPATTLP